MQAPPNRMMSASSSRLESSCEMYERMNKHSKTLLAKSSAYKAKKRLQAGRQAPAQLVFLLLKAATDTASTARGSSEKE